MSSISRRQAIAGAATATALLAGAKLALGAGPSVPPNIVYIMADDLGFADVSCYGRREYRTPNIDRLAAEGIRLTQAYANSAVCSATRVALITGRYQDRLPVGLFEPLSEETSPGLPPEHPTLPSLLKAAGYGTTLVGKWHLGWLPKYGPLQSGYDHFYGFRGGALDYFTHKPGIGPAVPDDLWDGDVKVHEAGYLTELLGDRAVKVVTDYAAARRPFLLSLHFNAPHWPWEGPEDAAESRRIKSLRDYDGGDMATYARMVIAMDRQIGRVMDALRVGGIERDTIVIFTSDNGGERFADTWPFTGKKSELLEGGLRIPAIVRWPAHIRPGSTSEQVAISMDWLPTLLEAARTKPDASYPSDGMSLLPMLKGGASVPPVMRTLCWRFLANRQSAIRDGNFKLLTIRENTFLFDVVRDPLERANLIAREPETAKLLQSKYDVWKGNMLPVDPKVFSERITGKQWADHYGASPDN